MYYEELRDGRWERIDIDGEMLMGRAHHVIYFATPERWLQYPAWAKNRRDEIIARITSEFREPDYEYSGLGAPGPSESAPPAPPPNVPRPAIPPSSGRKAPPQGARALLVAVLLLFALAGCMSWLVIAGVRRGETYLPTRTAYLRRTVVRQQEPAMFWASVGIYGAVGLGALTLGALGVRAGRRLT